MQTLHLPWLFLKKEEVTMSVCTLCVPVCPGATVFSVAQEWPEYLLNLDDISLFCYKSIHFRGSPCKCAQVGV